jgi:hypothetical protein
LKCSKLQTSLLTSFTLNSMPLEDTLETFSYFITEADKLGLAYITLLRYIEFFDLLIDGAYHSFLEYDFPSL